MTRILGPLPLKPLFARIDGVLRAGQFLLMEVELNEPALGLHLVPGASERFATALAENLGSLTGEPGPRPSSSQPRHCVP